MEAEHPATTAASPTYYSSSHTPHIVDPSHPPVHRHHHHHHQRSTHEKAHREHGRSVVVKRRFSSSTDGGAEASHRECCSAPPDPNTITTLSTDHLPHHHTTTNCTTTTTATPLPIPVITEYAPTLPYLNAPLIPFLAQAQQSVLASSSTSDLLLATTVSSGGGDHINVDDMQQHLPSLNCELYCEYMYIVVVVCLFVVLLWHKQREPGHSVLHLILFLPSVLPFPPGEATTVEPPNKGHFSSLLLIFWWASSPSQRGCLSLPQGSTIVVPSHPIKVTSHTESLRDMMPLTKITICMSYRHAQLPPCSTFHDQW